MKKATPLVFAVVFMVGFAGVVLAACPSGYYEAGGFCYPSSGGTGSFGGGTTNPSIQLCNPLASNCSGSGPGLVEIANRIINFLFTIAIPLTAILVLVGGFQMITAAGKPEKFSTGKKTIVYAAVGFAVVLLAKSVVPIIQSFVGG